MKPYIFSFDPGLMTGWALCKTDSMEVSSGELEIIPFLCLVDAWTAKLGVDLDVCGERFTITVATAKKSQAPWSLEVIGAVKYLAWKHGCGEIKLQAPADAKKFATNERLRAMGWWTPGTKGHDKDALRHLMIRLVGLGWSDERLLPD